MWKFGTAVAALILGAVFGAVTVRSGQAQEASDAASERAVLHEKLIAEYLLQRQAQAEAKAQAEGEAKDKGVPILEDIPMLGELFLQRTINKDGQAETRVQAVPAAPAHFMMPHAAPGTWQLHSHGDQLVLLNTTDGRAFRLDGEGDRAGWKPLPAPPRGGSAAMTHFVQPAKPAETRRADDAETQRKMLERQAEAAVMRQKALERLEHRLVELRKEIQVVEERLDAEQNDRARSELEAKANNLRAERQKVSEQLRELRQGAAKAGPDRR